MPRSSRLRAAAAVVLLVFPIAGVALGGRAAEAGPGPEQDVTNLFPRAQGGKGYLSVEVDAVDRVDHTSTRRRNPLEAQLDNMEYFYAMTLSIGTPPQQIRVLVDTGSSELWVNPDCSTAPTAFQQAQCIDFGRYNAARSTTPPFGPFGASEIHYGDATDPNTLTSVSIQYYRDTISIAGASIRNQTFGAVVSSKGQSIGILGLAPDLRSGFAVDTPYSFVLNSLFRQGIINSRTYALDLRHASDLTGAIIYGGLDKSKFVGTLERMPIVNGQGGEFRLAVTLSTIGLTVGDQSRTIPVSNADSNVMLDCGTTLSRLHANIATPLLRAIQAQSGGEGYWLAPCELRDTAGGVDFGFNGKNIRVPYSDFILSQSVQTSYGPYCFVGLVITESQQILGDSFMRAAYFVFDWDNRAVHIGQAANCGTEIVAIGSGPDAVPTVTGNCAGTGLDATMTAPHVTGAPTLSAYTTTYTITSCPPFDSSCRVGRVTTQTVLPEVTATVIAPIPTATPSSGNSIYTNYRRIALLVVSLATLFVMN